MASSTLRQGQHYLECDICKSPVQFTCKRCAVKLCSTCVGPHLLLKSVNGHEVTKYSEQNKSEDEECLTHPLQQFSAFCRTCDIPVCVLCVSIKHKTHNICEISEKVDLLSDFITTENERLQSMRSELETILDHISKRSAALIHVYKEIKNKISSHAKQWHQEIDKTENALHKDLDELQEKHAEILLKQKKEFEKVLKKLKNLKQRVFILTKSKDVSGLMELKLELENQKMPTFIEETRPAFFQPFKFDESYTTSYFGYVETIESHKLPINDLTQQDQISSSRQALDVPIVLSAFVTEFSADEETNRLYDMVSLSDDKVWIGGAGEELKLFDLQGRLHDTVTIADASMYLTLHDGDLVYTDPIDETVKKVINGEIETLFFIGEWSPRGITCTAARDFLVCLRSADETESKVVRYSSSGDVLQEIQYDSEYQPLFGKTHYVVENGNSDICVADWDKDAITVVDKFGIFRFSYTGNKASQEEFKPGSLTTDSMHHIIIMDDKNKIHMLDRDGRFLSYIIPDQGIKRPRAVCIVREGELMVGECITGVVKRIKYLHEGGNLKTRYLLHV
ncbi:uncharacterized protein LOC133188193 [Saccostrea echinata]|uniref:uncharacterized protein LOC133188193 n=1 Tax=Saccostrea echinata TaxID=191078 RepID=UPI002A802168|nr:uncharacterized protein LOC133188193 [Saccostrea echinata]